MATTTTRAAKTKASAPKASAEAKLATYRAKRRFDKTPEPSGDGAPTAPPEGSSRFVVQRHQASRLHYDFRLEIDGVLVSWAVPKGPTLDPKARHLAVHVEDHPVEYFDFEGVIPKGEYGGGDVIVWDWGTWSLAKGNDAQRDLRKGDLHIDLDGSKLHGRFVLVHRDQNRSGKEQWILLKKNDDDAVAGWDPEAHPQSVKSGRTNDEVLADPDHLWHSDLPADRAAVPTASTRWAAADADEVGALDALGPKGGSWSLRGRELKVTNLDKVLFPARSEGEAPVTKRDLIRYHALVAPWMLPYLDGRPVNLNRFPDGVAKKGFWHKAVPTHAPEWLNRWQNDEADPGETECYAVVDESAALAWMANYGAVELNPWTSRVADVHRPTWAFIDLDPGPTTTFDELLVLARLHRTALEHLGVEARPKVTGKRGIQVWVPVAPRYSFDETRTWVERLSKAVGATVPELVSWEWRTDARGGKARLDYTQNAINKTLVAPFSARPAAGAPVSVPIAWDELDDPDLTPDRWTVRDVLDRLAERGDPLAPLIGMPQRLPTL
ncbi:MAG: ATP-dependent DNA ligase [Acidimicrobiia bacterium]|nr:ATP-dependent DNA ligase [Acidimicrobiia bacterium]